MKKASPIKLGRLGTQAIRVAISALTRIELVSVKPQSGTCDRLENVMPISASFFINDDEGGLHQDYGKWLEKLAPHEPVRQYRHNDTGEDNADARMKLQIMGWEVVVSVTDGQLDFGLWDQIFYGEFDGRRRKRVLVKIIGE